MSVTPKLQVGQTVKLNPELFGKEAQFKPDGMYGELGYVGILRDVVWQITRIEKDTYRGEIAYASVTNAEQLKAKRSEGEAILLLKDLVPAVTKITLEYEIIDKAIDNRSKIDELLVIREVMKAEGFSKYDTEMKENWRKITALRNVAKEDGVPKIVSVLLPKQKVSFDILRKDLPDGTKESIDKFKMMLRMQLFNFRREQRNKANVKPVTRTSKQGSYTLTTVGGVHVKPGEPNAVYEEALKNFLDRDKLPTEKDANYIGIEIEFIFNGDEKKFREALISQRLHKNVQLTTDGSVYPCRNQNAYQGRELRVLCKDTEVEDIMARLDKAMAKVDAYANRSCGLHVHLDMRNRNPNLCFKNLVRVQPILRGSQPSGRLANKFCGENISEDIKEMTHKGTDGGRYAVINGHAFQTHKTIEIRVHEGTTDCSSIAKWALFLNSIVSHKEEIAPNKFKTAAELNKILSIPAASIQYVDARIERFDSLAV